MAALSAALLPVAATSQVSPDSGSTAAEQPERTYKYEVYAGYAYTSLNQINESRFGLQGVNVSVTRYWGRYFGLTAEGDDYRVAIATPVVVGSAITRICAVAIEAIDARDANRKSLANRFTLRPPRRPA